VRVLAEVAAAATVPVLAVGGVTRQTVRDVAATGAAGVAAIGLFADGAEEVLQVTVSEVNMAFDIPARVP
jgi:thiamine monophosphate synthase